MLKVFERFPDIDSVPAGALQTAARGLRSAEPRYEPPSGPLRVTTADCRLQTAERRVVVRAYVGAPAECSLQTAEHRAAVRASVGRTADCSTRTAERGVAVRAAVGANADCILQTGLRSAQWWYEPT